MSRLRFALLAAILLGTVAPPPGAVPPSSATSPAEEESPILHLEVTTVEGRTVQLKERLAKGPVLLDFWATWCKPCKAALPEVQKLHEKYAARGLTVLGVSLDGPRNGPKVRPFASQLGLTFANVLDERGDLQRTFQVLALPTSILIAPDGKIASTKMGYRPGEAERLGQEIEKLLLVPADTTAKSPAES